MRGLKILPSFFATFCGIVFIVIFLCSPCGGEQSDTAGDESHEATSTQDEISGK